MPGARHVSGSIPGDHCTRASDDVCSRSNLIQTWIILEFCDKGCLQEAMDRGWLRTERSAVSGGPNLAAVLATAREVASALAYLHSANVVHGDLSAWNVMLCSSGAAAAEGARGFVAKVADFGLSRTLEIRSKMQTANYGTVRTKQMPMWKVALTTPKEGVARTRGNGDRAWREQDDLSITCDVYVALG